MATMLPALEPDSLSLADVLTSSLAAITGQSNRLALPTVRSAVIVVIDGLGYRNIEDKAGHARFLAGAVRQSLPLRAGFPSTTAAMLATLATGLRPGEHGLTGYDVWDRDNQRVLNLLRGWDSRSVPEDWQASTTVFELAQSAGITSHVILSPKYDSSGYSRATLRGAAFHGWKSISERVQTAISLVNKDEPVLVYLYIPELDAASHRFGGESHQWLALLESVNAELASLERALDEREDVGLLITADHGSVDVPVADHVFYDTIPGLLDGVSTVAGEPRCLQLHLDDPSQADVVASAWRDAVTSAWIFTKQAAYDAGWFGAVNDTIDSRIGDVFVAAREKVAFYDSRDPQRVGRTMIGQHGSLTETELEVPLLRLAAFRPPEALQVKPRKPRTKSKPVL